MIAYHGTPCSGDRVNAAKFLAGRHAMVSFAAPSELPVVMDVCNSFVLDNGAYSIWKNGGQLDVEGYFDWVDAAQHHPGFDWALMPDVIDGSEQDNNALFRRWPFRHGTGVPIWHLHESLDWLVWLSGVYGRVALGSSGQWPTPGTDGWWDRMGEAMRVLDIGHGRPRCKLHGLRMLDPAIFTRLPFASADSTNAVRNSNLIGRFGMYPPPSQAARMATIADRIEAHQSTAVWVPIEQTMDLFMVASN